MPRTPGKQPFCKANYRSYVKGCSCWECCEAAATYRREYRAGRRRREENRLKKALQQKD